MQPLMSFQLIRVDTGATDLKRLLKVFSHRMDRKIKVLYVSAHQTAFLVGDLISLIKSQARGHSNPSEPAGWGAQQHLILKH